MRTENVAAFEKNCFFLLKVLQSEYTEYKGRKAPMTKTATVPSNLWRTTGRYILSQRVREYRADPADAGRIRGHSAG